MVVATERGLQVAESSGYSLAGKVNLGAEMVVDRKVV